MRSKRIIHLVEHIDDSYGGPAKSIPSLMSALAGHEFEQYLVSCSVHADEKNELIEKHGIRHVTSRQLGPSSIRYAPNLKKNLQDLIEVPGNTLMHIHNLWNYVPYVAWQIHNKTGCDYVLSPRGSLFPWCMEIGKHRKNIALWFFQKQMLLSAKIIHVTSQQEYDAVRRLGVDGNIEIVPNGIALSDFENLPSRNNALRTLSLPLNTNYVLFMSRIDKKKGLDILLRAFAENASKFTGWNLIIAGPIHDSVYWKECEYIIKRNNIDNRVHYLGMVKGKTRLASFAAANIFALPSHSENFGVAILEALAAGLPVISTHNTPWIEVNDKNAGIITDANVPSISEALFKLMSKSEQDLKLCELAAKKLSLTFSSENCASKMRTVYRKALNEAI
ncbi:glycosyltransferase [Rhodobacterales bacterium LSUCC1028]|nr:glycosyltransferase [Rhodobacterales bacterium LSUCC1028]